MDPIRISPSISMMVFQDGIEAYQEKKHPCHHLIQWQVDNGFSPVHMPEPFSGSQSSLGIFFIGLNPSITKDEVIPCFSNNNDFDAYDLYFRTRFDSNKRDRKGCPQVFYRDGTTKKAKLWSSLEIFGKNHIHPDFKLGEHALLTQTIPYKTTKGFLGNSSEKASAISHSKKFITETLNISGLKVVVPMGNDAWEQVQSVLHFIDNKAQGLTIMEAMGKRFKVSTPNGNELFVIPIKHMSYPPSKGMQASVGELIINSINI